MGTSNFEYSDISVRKANVLGLQTFLRDRFAIWASNGRSAEDVWNNFKNIILEGIERFVPHKIMRKNRARNATMRK
jgi:hypothetical protein